MMKTSLVVLLTLLGLAVTMSAADSASVGFETLKTLVGPWNGTTADGKSGNITFKVISGGAALMQLEPESDMVSVFHPDNERLLMTHYCASKNQPRMQAEISANGREFRFHFVDSTNLSASSGHMEQMTLTIRDTNHLTEKWVFLHNDGKEITEVWYLTRQQ
jgi:hypothetical protein